METKTAISLLGALAQESRLSIFRLLVEQGPAGLPVGRIGELLAVAPATLSFHLKELNHAGLITPRQDGRFIYYAANYEAMNALIGFLTDNCCRGDACSPAAATPCCPTHCEEPKP